MLQPGRIHGTESKYYADGEDAYDMRKALKEGASFGTGRSKHSLDAFAPPSIPSASPDPVVDDSKASTAESPTEDGKTEDK